MCVCVYVSMPMCLRLCGVCVCVCACACMGVCVEGVLDCSLSGVYMLIHAVWICYQIGLG